MWVNCIFLKLYLFLKIKIYKNEGNLLCIKKVTLENKQMSHHLLDEDLILGIISGAC